MNLLAIETSCDETAAAVIRDGELLCNIVASQEVHLQYGGVVPELASRAHMAKMVPIVHKALETSGLSLQDIDVVAATYGPGLIGSLLVGLTFAKGLALSLKCPFLGINHLEGHLFSAMLEHPTLEMPFLCLIVSGGHTILAEVRGVGDYVILGQTRDDAAGEAFDKVAKILELPYPGGPAIDKLARQGNPEAVAFPVARIKDNPLDFSFSGLKTAVLYHYQALSEEQREKNRADIAASFQKAVVQALISNIKKAINRTGIRRVVVAGGVARNSALAAAMADLAAEENLEYYIPAAQFCTDNAAMIAKAAELRYHAGYRSSLALSAAPNLPLTS